MKFTSRDRDNDVARDGNCAKSQGGWWYKRCSEVKLHSSYNSANMMRLNRQEYALPFMEMKIRPVNCNNH